ncbi:diphthine synthase [Chrysochromulina tobinii]|uniref:diphthine methyl ester synthase n=1 Tax=Chrysochromulina tobinii TaxID=1460289 RepID=A0A0M0JAI5_9EUKA|nr:diphthine synthase [Chrysochromulina tobinii]|eukprot:KOO23604.1 diphthine synthase [Chrysochromulina sp. CCMP291]
MMDFRSSPLEKEETRWVAIEIGDTWPDASIQTGPVMPFHLIGLGLADEEDITLKGLRAVQKCSAVYLEAYTSILGVPRARLEEAWSIKIEEAPRELVESEIEPILERARHEDIAMLVVGDPFGATTHCDLLARARELGVTTHVVHNASIMNAIGCCGLQLYRFGETISIPFFSQTWRPDSFYAKVAANRRAGLHTLALLDIKVREPTMISLAKGKKPEYLPPRYMSIRQAIGQLLAVEAERAEGVCPPEARAIGVSRVGHADQQVVTGTLEELRAIDFGGPLHSLVLIGTLGLDEAELLGAFAMAAAALEAQGVKVAGGMHKFDASEVDVNGGTATADEFLDAFGFD